MDRQHIAVVDDEPDIRSMLATYLARQGFDVSAAESGDALRRVLAERPADLVLLDINMPGEDGLSIARYLRANSQSAVIMVTASGETSDRIIGLEMGADDYIAKPFDPRELLARIRSVLRRAARPAQAAKPAEAEHLVGFGAFTLDLNAHKLLDPDGAEVPLKNSEYMLLKVFAAHPDKVMSRERLLDLASNRDLEPFDRSIDVRITRIRRKIEVDPAKPQIIKTVRGAGYLFARTPAG